MTTGTNKPVAFLFHPGRSVTHILGFNPGWTDFDLPLWGRSGKENGPTWDWYGDEARSHDGTQTMAIAASSFSAAEAIGVPSTLISPLTRVTGGVLTMRITCGPGTTGYFAYSSPASSELSTNGATTELYGAHATNPRIRRHELVQGTQTHHFIAPITNAPALEHFAEANDRFLWGSEDPFGGTLITFHDIHYNANLGVAPVVEIYSTVGLQCRLEVADRHLATNHATSSKQAKVKQSTGDGSAHIGATKDGHTDHVNQSQKVDAPH